MVILAVRKNDVFQNPQLWAEDGAIFLGQAESFGLRSLFIAYEGYLHLTPRIIAWLGTALPMVAIPSFFATCALLTTGLVAWILQSPRIPLRAGWAAALALVAIPHTGEVYLAICNLQWITAIALFALLAADDARNLSQRAGDVAIAIIFGLTGPFVVLAAPLFFFRAWVRRTRESGLLAGVTLAAVLVQLPSLLHRAPNPAAPAWQFSRLMALECRRVILQPYFSDATFPPTVALALGLLFCGALCVWLWKRAPALPRAGYLCAAAIFVLAAISFKARPDTWDYNDLTNGDRYFYIPKVLLTWIAAASVGIMSLRARRIGVVLLLLPFVASLPKFVYPPAAPQHWEEFARRIERGQPTTVSILPEGFTFFHPGRGH